MYLCRSSDENRQVPIRGRFRPGGCRHRRRAGCTSEAGWPALGMEIIPTPIDGTGPPDHDDVLRRLVHPTAERSTDAIAIELPRVVQIPAAPETFVSPLAA
jgi:hypothetical protein